MSFEPETVRAFEHAGWQRAAARYEATFAHATAPFIAPLLDAAGVAVGTRVLDIACGPGYVAAAAAARGAVASGLDFSAAMVGIARAAHPAITITEGDAEAMPFGDSTFDAVVSSFGLHHVPRPERALRETRRVLAAGGRVAVTVWAAPSDNIAWSLLFDAIDRHGDRAAAKTPPSGGAFNRPEHCLAALDAAGFTESSADIVRAEWRVPNAEGLIAAFCAGTVRTAALIAAQGQNALPAIVADIDRKARRYRRGDMLAIPIAAILARGRRSR